MEELTRIPLLSKIPELDHGITTLHLAEQRAKELTATCCLARQIHGAKMAWVSSFEQRSQEADALATLTPNLRIGVYTADCAPILCAAVDRESGKAFAVMSIHAGWRGAAAGIQSQCLRDFVKKTSPATTDYFVGIGPTISFDTFEVGQEVVDAFPQIEARGHARFTHFEEDRRKYLLNLPAEIEFQLRQESLNLGIQLHLERLDHCTHKMNDTYPSYRRQKGSNSRILSFISFSN